MSSTKGRPVLLQGPQESYFCPLDAEADRHLERRWQQLTAAEPDAKEAMDLELPVMFGRTITVRLLSSWRLLLTASHVTDELLAMQIPRSKGGVAFFTFEDLCKGMRGASDYIAVSQAFHTVFIAGIPAMSMQVTQCIGSKDVQLLSSAFLYARISLLLSSANCSPSCSYATRPGVSSRLWMSCTIPSANSSAQQIVPQILCLLALWESSPSLTWSNCSMKVL